jgi:zinc protease
VNHWPKGHPYYTETFDESLAGVRAVTLAQVQAFHREFYGANHANIAVVGDFDPAQTKAKLVALFGDWNSQAPYVRIANTYQAFPAVDEKYKTPDKANGVLYMSTTVPVSRFSPDFPALVMADNIFGGGSLKSRLADRVRQKDGLSYGVGTQFDADRIDESGSLFGYAIAAPENLAKVEVDFREELARLLKDGVSADELNNAVAGVLKERMALRADDAYLASKLASDLFIDHTMKDTEKYEGALQAQTPETVTAAARKYFKPEVMSFFVAGDLDAAAKKAAAAKP